MKIEHRFYLSHLVNIGLIFLIGAFSLHSFNQILAKFRFTEIADDLNATFLEMRLSEKNYFLYHDNEALAEIQKKIVKSDTVLDEMKDDIVRAIGQYKLDRLQELLANYHNIVKEVSLNKKKDPLTRHKLREVGQSLKEFSENMTAIEREQVGVIISQMTKILSSAFAAIVIFAFINSQLNGRSIRRSLHQIVSLTHSISKGNYQEISIRHSNDEMGFVIKAINAMARELKRREQEILQSKRLASIGVLVAGVAHELNNPLNNISMIAQTYAEVYDHLEKEQRLGFMEQIEEQTERLRLTIKNLLDFSKPKEQKLEEQDINDVIQNALGLVQNMLDISNIKTRLDLAEMLPPVYIDKLQIQQVLVNLATNAIQAMAEGGDLRLTSRYLAKNEEIEIEIRDSGKGIPPEFLDHIFDPFFSTKDEGGTGLGLWVSYGIIKNHHGNIRVESTVGQGTVFTITLPAFKRKERSINGKA